MARQSITNKSPYGASLKAAIKQFKEAKVLLTADEIVGILKRTFNEQKEALILNCLRSLKQIPDHLRFDPMKLTVSKKEAIELANIVFYRATLDFQQSYGTLNKPKT